MEIREFQLESIRTMRTEDTTTNLIIEMVFGLNGECGEVTDLLKKHLFHHHNLNVDSLKEEIGDIMYYLVNLCNLYNIDIRTVLQVNHDKLLERYPNGFEVAKSIRRE